MHVVALSDQDGEFVEFYEYDAYGAVTVFDSEGDELADGSVAGNDHFFTGRRYDRDLELYYYRNRWYDPHAGRFLSRDPLGLWGDSLNLGNGMGYVGQSPWNYVDPLGLEGTCTPRVYDWNTMDAEPMGWGSYFYESLWDVPATKVGRRYDQVTGAVGGALSNLFDPNGVNELLTDRHNLNNDFLGGDDRKEHGELADILGKSTVDGSIDLGLYAAGAGPLFKGVHGLKKASSGMKAGASGFALRHCAEDMEIIHRMYKFGTKKGGIEGMKETIAHVASTGKVPDGVDQRIIDLAKETIGRAYANKPDLSATDEVQKARYALLHLYEELLKKQ